VEITYCRYIEAIRKLVIGDERGEVGLYCVGTGLFCGRLVGHGGSIVHVDYDESCRMFVTMGQDSSIMVQKYVLDYANRKV
jgi:hypothetical protein